MFWRKKKKEIFVSPTKKERTQYLIDGLSKVEDGYYQIDYTKQFILCVNYKDEKGVISVPIIPRESAFIKLYSPKEYSNILFSGLTMKEIEATIAAFKMCNTK
jgi:hypothetical protein